MGSVTTDGGRKTSAVGYIIRKVMQENSVPLMMFLCVIHQ
jgi:hypothetical protein